MVNKTKGLLHQNIRKRISKKYEPYPSPDKIKNFYDKFIYIVVILAPLTNIPQLLKIFAEKNASGVSPLSWFFYSGISITWAIYGILHKDKHILLMNLFLILTQLTIAIGALLYG